MGVNSGHNNDTSWLVYMKRLNANGVRVFGLAGSIPSSTQSASGLQTWVTTKNAADGNSGSWGADFNGVAVTSLATFTSAVALMRTHDGHTPGAGSFTNPPRWATYEGMMTSNLGAPAAEGHEARALSRPAPFPHRRGLTSAPRTIVPAPQAVPPAPRCCPWCRGCRTPASRRCWCSGCPAATLCSTHWT